MRNQVSEIQRIKNVESMNNEEFVHDTKIGIHNIKMWYIIFKLVHDPKIGIHNTKIDKWYKA